jgi:hypothetical protein
MASSAIRTLLGINVPETWSVAIRSSQTANELALIGGERPDASPHPDRAATIAFLRVETTS